MEQPLSPDNILARLPARIDEEEKQVEAGLIRLEREKARLKQEEETLQSRSRRIAQTKLFFDDYERGIEELPDPELSAIQELDAVEGAINEQYKLLRGGSPQTCKLAMEKLDRFELDRRQIAMRLMDVRLDKGQARRAQEVEYFKTKMSDPSVAWLLDPAPAPVDDLGSPASAGEEELQGSSRHSSTSIGREDIPIESPVESLQPPIEEPPAHETPDGTQEQNKRRLSPSGNESSSRKKLRTTEAAAGPSQARPTITFDEVFKGKYKHRIVERPKNSDQFYILKCDQHELELHFGMNALEGAAKHLCSEAHGYLSKTHDNAIEVLGVKVTGCTKEKMLSNNRAFAEALAGTYIPLNNKSGNHKKWKSSGGAESAEAQARESGGKEREVEAQVTTGPSILPRRHKPGIVDPVPGHVYTGFWYKWHAVMVLPTGDFEEPIFGAIGFSGSFADARLLEREDNPDCYRFCETTNRILGWATGYEDGGPKVAERIFPVLFWDLGGDGFCSKASNPAWLAAKDLGTNFGSVDYIKDVDNFMERMRQRLAMGGTESAEAGDQTTTHSPRASALDQQTRHAEVGSEMDGRATISAVTTASAASVEQTRPDSAPASTSARNPDASAEHARPDSPPTSTSARDPDSSVEQARQAQPPDSQYGSTTLQNNMEQGCETPVPPTNDSVGDALYKQSDRHRMHVRSQTVTRRKPAGEGDAENNGITPEGQAPTPTMLPTQSHYPTVNTSSSLDGRHTNADQGRTRQSPLLTPGYPGFYTIDNNIGEQDRRLSTAAQSRVSQAPANPPLHTTPGPFTNGLATGGGADGGTADRGNSHHPSTDHRHQHRQPLRPLAPATPVSQWWEQSWFAEGSRNCGTTAGIRTPGPASPLGPGSSSAAAYQNQAWRSLTGEGREFPPLRTIAAASLATSFTQHSQPLDGMAYFPASNGSPYNGPVHPHGASVSQTSGPPTNGIAGISRPRDHPLD